MKNNAVMCFHAHSVAVNAMFTSFPFAPTRSGREWWWGYQLVEMKLTAENSVMFAASVLAEWNSQDITVMVSSTTFGVMFFFANLLGILIMHHQVISELHHRKIFTTVPIVDLFKNMCAYLTAKTATGDDAMRIHKQDEAHLNQLNEYHGLTPAASRPSTSAGSRVSVMGRLNNGKNNNVVVPMTLEEDE